jgi:hypothetical protein
MLRILTELYPDYASQPRDLRTQMKQSVMEWLKMKLGASAHSCLIQAKSQGVVFTTIGIPSSLEAEFKEWARLELDRMLSPGQ